MGELMAKRFQPGPMKSTALSKPAIRKLYKVKNGPAPKNPSPATGVKKAPATRSSGGRL
jgi:hypothetical protein